MRPKAVLFSVAFAFVLALSLIIIPQDASAGSSEMTPPAPVGGGGEHVLYFVDIMTEGYTDVVGSPVHIKGKVYIGAIVSPSERYVEVTMTDPNGMEYLDLATTKLDGIFEAEFFPSALVPGVYNVTASADAFWTHKVNDSILINFVPVTPEPEGEEESGTMGYIQAGTLLAAVASLALAGTESAGFSLFNIFAFPLYSRIKKEEVLDHFVRGQIYGYIVSNPGEHYNSIREKLKVTNGTLSYHLRTLEIQGFVKSRKESIYRRFYPVEMKFPRDKGVKLSDLQIAILELTRLRPAPTQKEIAEELEISQQVASYNLRMLAVKGYVDVQKEGRKRIYRDVDSQSSTSL